MKKSQEKHFGIKNRCFLWAKGLAICFFAIFAMSHNVSAFTVSQNVDIKQVVNSPNVSYYNGTSWSSYATGLIRFTSDSGNFSMMRIRKSDFSSIDSFNVGDYVILSGFFTANELFYNAMSRTYVAGGFIGTAAENVNCSIIELEFDSVQEYYQNSNGWYKADFQMTCRVVTESTSNLTMNFRVRPDILSVSGTQLNVSINSAIIAQATSDSQKEEDAANENIEQNEQDSNASSTDAENASQSLISAIGGFVSSITSASPSNCNINGNMGNFDLGNIDLCANPVPSYIQIISSFILISLCIPFAIVMFNRFINLFRSFQT